MKHTEAEIEFLNILSKSDVGADLCKFIDRLCDHIADVRNWSKDDTKESALQAVSVLKKELRDKIVKVRPSALIQRREYE